MASLPRRSGAACERIRYVIANEWSACRYLDVSRLEGTLEEAD